MPLSVNPWASWTDVSQSAQAFLNGWSTSANGLHLRVEGQRVYIAGFFSVGATHAEGTPVFEPGLISPVFMPDTSGPVTSLFYMAIPLLKGSNSTGTYSNPIIQLNQSQGTGRFIAYGVSSGVTGDLLFINGYYYRDVT